MGLETGAQVSLALRRLMQLLQNIILSCSTGLTSEMQLLQTVVDDFLPENNGSPGIVCHIQMVRCKSAAESGSTGHISIV